MGERKVSDAAMLLAIDVGNTQTALGIYYEGDQVTPSYMWRFATNKNDTADDLCAKLFPRMGADGVDLSQIDNIIMASVVPSLSEAWEQAVLEFTGVEVQICSARRAQELGLFETTYSNPEEIGADRVADAVAARKLFGEPVVVVDFGTATNIEVIDAQGRFVGGIIAPGVKIAANALFEQATLLVPINLNTSTPQSVIGTSSKEAILSGIFYGEADRVDGLVRRVFDQIGKKCPVVATGGLALLIVPYSQEITDVLSELTLEGLRLIACH